MKLLNRRLVLKDAVRGFDSMLFRRTEPPTGHGRYAAKDYPGADQVDIEHPEHSPGDVCPDCGQGTLYEKTPGVLVRFVGRAPLHATVYRMLKLRCHLCGKLFTAPTPDDIGEDKYDHTAGSMIGLLKYGTGFPFNRVQRLQGNCEIPLAASTQWDIVHGTALQISPAYGELIRQAAQGEVVFNDDTTTRILELMGERLRKNPLPDNELGPAALLAVSTLPFTDVNAVPEDQFLINDGGIFAGRNVFGHVPVEAMAQITGGDQLDDGYRCVV